MQANPVTFGDTLRVLDAGGFVLREVRYAPQSVIPPHQHDTPVFVLSLSGEMTGTVEGAVESYPPLSLRSVPAGASHSNSYGKGSPRCLLMEVTASRSTQLHAHTSVLDRFVQFEQSTLPAMIASRAYRELQRADSLSPLAIEGLMLELLAATGRKTGPASAKLPPAWLKQIRNRLTDEFRSPISLEGLAREHGVHPVHVARLFRLHFGCAPSEYVRRLRIEWAAWALTRSDEPIALVAQEAGFADQSHFTREFRRATGVTPARYRAAPER